MMEHRTRALPPGSHRIRGPTRADGGRVGASSMPCSSDSLEASAPETYSQTEAPHEREANLLARRWPSGPPDQATESRSEQRGG